MTPGYNKWSSEKIQDRGIHELAVGHDANDGTILPSTEYDTTMIGALSTALADSYHPPSCTSQDTRTHVTWHSTPPTMKNHRDHGTNSTPARTLRHHELH